MSLSLIDTSIWIDFFRSTNKELDILLEKGEVVIHPFIIGELACGNFTNRVVIFQLLNRLPICKPLLHNEVVQFIEKEKLFGKGLGWIDIHLLAAARLNNFKLITLDKRLKKLSNKYT